MASGKKTSKNQKSGTKGKSTTFIQEKRVKPKKSEILIEMTKEVINQLFEEEKDGVLTTTLNGKEILGTIIRYGKRYVKVKNT